MNKENASKLWKIIQEAGDYLEGQLLKLRFIRILCLSLKRITRIKFYISLIFK